MPFSIGCRRLLLYGEVRYCKREQWPTKLRYTDAVTRHLLKNADININTKCEQLNTTVD